MFKGVLKNVDNFDLHFYGNIKPDTVGEIIVKQGKRAYRKLEKPVLESQVVPIEVYKIILSRAINIYIYICIH